jgi:hypothetical protein
MKLVVCGSSWSSVSKKLGFEGTHWSELLSKKLNATLLNLAVGGASNSNIRLQLDAAKELEPNFILFNAENAIRIDIKNLNKNNLKKNVKKYNSNNFAGRKTSTNHLITVSPSIIEQESKITELVTNKQRQAIYDYYEYIYDDIWKKQTDQYIMNSGILDLYINNFNFLFNPYLLSDDFDLPKFIKEKHFVDSKLNFKIIRDMYTFSNKDDPGYHVSKDGQKIIAELYYTEITNYIEKYGLDKTNNV